MFNQVVLCILYSRKMILHRWKLPSSVCVESRFGQVCKRPTLCPIETLNLRKEAFQNKSIRVQSCVGEHGSLILTPEYLIIIIIFNVLMGLSPLPTYSLLPQSEYLLMLHQSVTQNLHVSNIWHSTFKVSAASLPFYAWIEALSDMTFLLVQKLLIIVWA